MSSVAENIQEAEVVHLKPWIKTVVVHVYPGKDLIEHGLGKECICKPEAEAMDDHIIVRHKALDGRKN